MGLVSSLPRLARPAAPASCAYFEPRTGDGGAFTRGRGAQLVLCGIGEFFTAMMPDYVGWHFDLDVIAGHIATETISGIPGYRGIWHDGASHYYVDGNVVENGHVLVLRYDEATGRYSGEGLE